ncbi:MAG: hypothetical protein ACKV0T_31330 [Planctomycetales bacterium]
MEAVQSELTQFRTFIDAQIGCGRTDLTPEQTLQLWRECRTELGESVTAVRRALSELDSGQPGRPLREFIQDFRVRNQIPADE